MRVRSKRLKKLSRCFVEDSFVNMIRNRKRFSGNEWNGEKEEESEKKRRREMRERERKEKKRFLSSIIIATKSESTT